MELPPQLVAAVAARLPRGPLHALASVSPWYAAVLAERMRAVAHDEELPPDLPVTVWRPIPYVPVLEGSGSGLASEEMISRASGLAALQMAVESDAVDTVERLLDGAAVVVEDGLVCIQYPQCGPETCALDHLLFGPMSFCRRRMCEVVLKLAPAALVPVRLCADLDTILVQRNEHDVGWVLTRPNVGLLSRGWGPGDEPARGPASTPVHTEKQSPCMWQTHVLAVAVAAQRPWGWLCPFVVRRCGITRHDVMRFNFLPLQVALAQGHAATAMWMVDHFELVGEHVPDQVLFHAARVPNIPLCEWLVARLRWEAGAGTRLLRALAREGCPQGCLWVVRQWGLTRADVHAACEGAVLESWLVARLPK